MQLNIITSLCNTGYGIVGKNLVKALHKLGHDIYVFPLGKTQPDSQDDSELFDSLIKKSMKFPPFAPCLNIWHQFDLAKRVGSGPYYVYPFFELDTFRDIEKHHLSFPAKVFVSSKWAQDIVSNQVGRELKDVIVAPPGVDTSIFKQYDIEDKEKIIGENYRIPFVFHGKKFNNDDYVFINIGKWEKRKGHDILGRCFDKAFTPKDNVRLILMPHNPFITDQQDRQWRSQYKSLRMSKHISIFPYVVTSKEVAEIMSCCDCGVFPSRAEGWNLELMECMACGLPVIATYYSAHTEFLKASDAFLINIDNTELAHDGIWFNGEGNWAEFDYEQEEQLIDYMRLVYQNKISTNSNGLDTAKTFTWERTAQIIVENIE